MCTLPIDETATVLVTGATGFLGRALLQQLATRGCRIKVLARPGSSTETLKHNYNAEIIRGDILSTTAVKSACEDTTHIFHLASRGQSQTSSKTVAETRRVNIDGTKLLGNCITQLGTLPRVVHCSTIAVHGHVENGPGNVRSTFNAETNYELTKLEGELWFRNFADRSGIPLTVLRPCAIVGPGDFRLLKLFRLANRRWVPIVGKGNHRYQMIHVEDCVSSLIAAGEMEAAVGKTYVCGYQEALTLREVIETISPTGSRIFTLPRKPIAAVVSVLETLFNALGLVSPFTSESLGIFSKNHWFETKSVQEELGVQYKFDTRMALQMTRAWYRDQGFL